MKFVLEFRSGTYFKSLDSQSGGKLAEAKRFPTKDEAQEFARDHYWIMRSGGRPVEVAE